MRLFLWSSNTVVLRKSFVFHLSYTRKKSIEKQNPIFLLSSSSISTEYKWRKCTIVRTFKKAATINYEPESLLRHQIHNKRRELPWKPPFYSSFQPFIMTLFFILFHHLSSTFLMTIIYQSKERRKPFMAYIRKVACLILYIPIS